MLIAKEAEDEWSFYDLTGCPGDLIAHLLDLAELAKQNEIAATTKWLKMDPTPVLHIEAAIKAWQNPFADSFTSFPSASDASKTDAQGSTDPLPTEEEMQNREDQYHVVEAWRLAMQAYVERLFNWDRSQKPPRILTIYARRTLDHVRCCRHTSQTQKQALLPVFLAGSETGDQEMRAFSRNYCDWWTTRSRYNMFNTVISLLDVLWEEQSDGKSAAIWWGSIIDKKSGLSAGKVERQFLFG